MSKFSDAVGEFLAEFIALVVGWSICMAMLGGGYALGFWLAPHFGGDQHRDAFGILSAIVIIWTYERRQAHERWGHLNDMIDNLYDRKHR